MSYRTPAVLERMCHTKRIFLDATLAQIEADRLTAKHQTFQRTYQCPNCKFWHLTTKAAA